MNVPSASYDRILKVAGEIFYKKGLAGARMQEIADEAGINKAMLHYYFKSKELLFNKVFELAFKTFAGGIAEVLNSTDKLTIKINNYVDHTIKTLTKLPGIIVFITYELHTNPARITDIFTGEGSVNFSVFREQVKVECAGKIDPEMLFTDMIALCVYPFIAQPILKKMMNKSDESYLKFLDDRKAWIKKTLINQL